MKKRVCAIIEVRMGSTRLPGKTMMPILGRPSFELLMERLKLASRLDDLIVATTDRPEDDVIERFCEGKGYPCYRGSSSDVLGRVYNAAIKCKADIIVEVTGDCIVLDPWLIDDCIAKFLDSDCDYLSNFIEQSYPPGIDVQIFTFEALSEMNKLAKSDKYREHVTLYILKNQEKFRISSVKAPPELSFPDWHLELDEMKDYELLKKIYETLYPKDPHFKTSDIIDLLKSNPMWLDINRDVKRAWEAARKDKVE